MRNFTRILFLAVLFTPLALAQSNRIEVRSLSDHPFQVDYASGKQLSIRVRSGDVRVIGSAENKVTVKVEAKDRDRAREVTVRFERLDNSAELGISGGPKNDVRITVEVPKATGLFVRMPFGQLEISDVTGDKDVQLHAGELIVHVGNPADYSHVDASVTTGGLKASPFNEDHGGLFRSFEKSGNGKYKLHAHVGTGDLTLR
jgi:hypothetical protein